MPSVTVCVWESPSFVWVPDGQITTVPTDKNRCVFFMLLTHNGKQKLMKGLWVAQARSDLLPNVYNSVGGSKPLMIHLLHKIWDFCFSKKSVNFFLHANYLDIKKVIFIWKMLLLSFHTPGKTSCKMPKMAREICFQVREKVGEIFADFWWEPCQIINKKHTFWEDAYYKADKHTTASSPDSPWKVKERPC